MTQRSRLELRRRRADGASSARAEASVRGIALSSEGWRTHAVERSFRCGFARCRAAVDTARRQVSYSFLFMQADGAGLRELAALYDAGHLCPVIDTTFPFDQTVEALAYVEQGRANGKVVITLD
jgi:NADPH:quinone reductase-like Zn-dependent oxidoreductase